MAFVSHVVTSVSDCGVIDARLSSAQCRYPHSAGQASRIFVFGRQHSSTVGIFWAMKFMLSEGGVLRPCRPESRDLCHDSSNEVWLVDQ